MHIELQFFRFKSLYWAQHWGLISLLEVVKENIHLPTSTSAFSVCLDITVTDLGAWEGAIFSLTIREEAGVGLSNWGKATINLIQKVPDIGWENRIQMVYEQLLWWNSVGGM